MSSSSPISLYEGSPLSCVTHYGSLVGALEYCTLTIHDINYFINNIY